MFIKTRAQPQKFLGAQNLLREQKKIVCRNCVDSNGVEHEEQVRVKTENQLKK